MRYDLVVFDWDGTLSDSMASIVHCMAEAIGASGEAVPPELSIREIIGLGLEEAVARLLPQRGRAIRSAVVARYRDTFRAQSQEQIGFFPGVQELLGRLSGDGFLMGVATGKSRAGLERALDHHGVRHHFQATRTVDECHSKPHPQMLEELMEVCGVSPHRTLMVGDSEHDLRMAANAGVGSVAVTYGALSRDQLVSWEPLACIDHISELVELI